MSRLIDWDPPDVAGDELSSSGDSPSSDDVAPFGKSPGTGGGGKLVRLLAVNPDVYCLGFIGTSKSKICLGPTDCVTKSHEREKFQFPDAVSEMVVIEVSGTSAAAYAQPAIDLSSLGSSWEELRSETRTVLDWQNLLQSLLYGAGRIPTRMST